MATKSGSALNSWILMGTLTVIIKSITLLTLPESKINWIWKYFFSSLI